MEETERKPIFTNTYVPNEEIDRQMYRSVNFVRRLILFLICIAFLCYSLYKLIQLIQWAAYYREPIYTQTLFWFIIVGFVLYGFLIVRGILAPRIFARKETKRLKETYGTTEITVKFTFFDDALEMHNLASGAKWNLPYTSLKRMTETKDLFLIRTQQKQIIPIAKLGFDGTDIPGFRAFMDEKCPNAKRKWRKAK